MAHITLCREHLHMYKQYLQPVTVGVEKYK